VEKHYNPFAIYQKRYFGNFAVLIFDPARLKTVRKRCPAEAILRRALDFPSPPLEANIRRK
jgi:hypothetical protein